MYLIKNYTQNFILARLETALAEFNQSLAPSTRGSYSLIDDASWCARCESALVGPLDPEAEKRRLLLRRMENLISFESNRQMRALRMVRYQSARKALVIALNEAVKELTTSGALQSVAENNCLVAYAALNGNNMAALPTVQEPERRSISQAVQRSFTKLKHRLLEDATVDVAPHRHAITCNTKGDCYEMQNALSNTPVIELAEQWHVHYPVALELLQSLEQLEAAYKDCSQVWARFRNTDKGSLNEENYQRRAVARLDAGGFLTAEEWAAQVERRCNYESSRFSIELASNDLSRVWNDVANLLLEAIREAASYQRTMLNGDKEATESVDLGNALKINCLIADTRLHRNASAIVEYNQTAGEDANYGICNRAVRETFRRCFEDAK